MTRPIRFGVAGTAFWAREVPYSRAGRTIGHRPRRRVGTQCRTTRSAAQSRGIQAFRTFDEMLDHVDAVSVAVAPDAQPSLALAAARAGKHLLLEKPIALSSAAAMPLIKAIASNGVASIVFFMRRFVPLIADAVDDAARQHWHSASVRVHSAALTSATPFSNSPWRHNDGAELWDIGPHALSILVPILGPVIRIDARRQPGGCTTFTTTHVGGSTADVSLTLKADPGSAGIEYRFNRDGTSLTLPEPPIARARRAIARCRRLGPQHCREEDCSPARTHPSGSKSYESSKLQSRASHCAKRLTSPLKARNPPSKETLSHSAEIFLREGFLLGRLDRPAQALRRAPGVRFEPQDLRGHVVDCAHGWFGGALTYARTSESAKRWRRAEQRRIHGLQLLVDVTSNGISSRTSRRASMPGATSVKHESSLPAYEDRSLGDIRQRFNAIAARNAR